MRFVFLVPDLDTSRSWKILHEVASKLSRLNSLIISLGTGIYGYGRYLAAH